MLELNVLFQNIGNKYTDLFFLLISYLITDIPLVLTLCFIYWCISKEKGIRMGFVLLNGMQINFIVKDIFKVKRPYELREDIVNKDIKYGYGYSFPSNHSQISISFFLSLKKVFQNIKKMYPWYILVGFVGLSRIYLGVHSILDVVCGFILGWILVEVFYKAIDYIMNSKRYYIAYIFAVLGVIGIVFFKDEDSLKILLLYLGFLTGFIIENRFIGYIPPKKTKNKIINYIMGIMGIVIVYTLIHGPLKYLLLGLFITLPAPYIFKLIERKVK